MTNTFCHRRVLPPRKHLILGPHYNGFAPQVQVMLGGQRVKRKSLVGVLTAPQTFEISLTLDADPSPSANPDPEAGSKIHPEAGSKSHSEAGLSSHPEAGSTAGAEGGAKGGAEAGPPQNHDPEAGLQRAGSGDAAPCRMDAGRTRLVSVTMGVLAQVLPLSYLT